MALGRWQLRSRHVRGTVHPAAPKPLGQAVYDWERAAVVRDFARDDRRSPTAIRQTEYDPGLVWLASIVVTFA